MKRSCQFGKASDSDSLQFCDLKIYLRNSIPQAAFRLFPKALLCTSSILKSLLFIDSQIVISSLALQI
ncbi:hypothetical protein C0J52_20374 [Blattella germanica]|nr:hypothetical protein C0J52_20374 [Blattella germanica]